MAYSCNIVNGYRGGIINEGEKPKLKLAAAAMRDRNPQVGRSRWQGASEVMADDYGALNDRDPRSKLDAASSRRDSSRRDLAAAPDRTWWTARASAGIAIP